MKRGIGIILLVIVILIATFLVLNFYNKNLRSDCSPIELYDFNERIDNDDKAANVFQMFLETEDNEEINKARETVYYRYYSLRTPFNRSLMSNPETSNFKVYGYRGLMLKSNGKLLLYMGYFCK